MKKLMLTLVLLMSVICGAMAQSESLYIYRNNGSIISIPKSKIENVSYSKYDTDNLLQDNYVTQIIVTSDSVCKIPLAEIDSVSLFAPDPEQSISPAFIPIDWETASISSCDKENCSYSLQFSGDIPEIIPSSVIVMNEDTVSHIVLVTDVVRNGNSIEIKGEYGDMSYLLFDTEFDVEGNGDVLNSSSKKRVQSHNALNKAVEISKEFKWEYPGKIDLYDKGGAKSYIDYKSTIKVTPSFKFSFGDKITTWKQGIKFIRAKNFDVDFKIKGDFEIAADLTAEFNSENTNIDLAPNQEDKYELVPQIKIPTREIFVTIGVLTVPIRIGGNFYKQTTLDVKNSHAKFTVGFDAKASGTIGYKYDGTNNTGGSSYVDFDFDKNLHNPYIEGNIDVEGKFYFFPRIHAWICDYTGPSIDIKPYFRTEITGGFRKDMLESSKSDYCAWSLTNAAGVDWSLGWSTSAFFFDLEQSNTQLLNGTFTDPDWKLYESPKNIEFVSAEPEEIKKGTPMEVSFQVLDKSFLGELPTCLPQLVKFETNRGTVEGNLFDGFSYAEKGIVTAKWIPGSNSDVLYARLYNKSGDVIAEAHYGDENVPEVITGDVTSVTSNSAKVECTFLNIPQGAECGVDYWTHGVDGSVGTKTIQFEGDSLTCIITLDGLAPNTDYTCCAYVRVGNDYYDGEERTFRTCVSLPQITDFKQTGSHYSQGGYNNDGRTYDYKFEVATTVEIESLDGIADWGYVYKDPYGNIKRISLMGHGTSYTDTRYAYYRNESKSTACLYGYAYIIGMEEPIYGEIHDFPLDHAMAVANTGNCVEVKTKSATVNCLFENVPQGAKCGVEYRYEEIWLKHESNSSEGTQTITLNGLHPGTKYYYRAYIDDNGQMYYGGEKTFTTQVELPNLAGTWNCTVYKDDGSVLDTPTLTLTPDGKATIKNSSFTSEDKVGGWSIKANGNASISFNWASSGYNLVYFQEAYGGTVNSMTNPSSIEGTVSRRWAGMSEHGNSYKFKMTR